MTRQLTGPRDAVGSAADTALEAAGVCDDTDSAACLLPFPNDRFTVADPTTATGRRVALHPLATPRNVAGRPVDVTELNRNDGFSPGTPILTSVPGLDAARSGLAGIGDLQASLKKDAAVVLLDATTGKRAPYWAELDANPTDGEQPLLIVRPAVNLTEGHRYVVGMRGLRDARGALDRAGPAVRRAAGRRPGGRPGLRPAGRRQGEGPRPLPGLGLHRREHPQPDRAHAAHA